MDELKDIRWKQRFENFEKSFHLLEKYSGTSITNELERAGIIQFYETTFELAWKVLKDYLEVEGYVVKSPRETIKQAFQAEIIEDGHIWMDALSKRNLTVHTYDQELAEKLVLEIQQHFLPILRHLYDKLLKER
ncbi:nucleotidyltransferase substrate binding protein (TIGR01987 family) [Gracilibacillus halotolerans]|uniref:Nucleotidyltransferase substrate binding protein (TIGR01987 family) n=1 Tax=Gracilibacillus halotolerans TaxID=74386 RepID=A0A841RMW3_9BACI|nr:nucleotidyltransferase substrate binding protein [Gracilibacillus halotolerans]MBB6512028.1 nucleotidyltransferase substrate binding protein (TIGR01987 family) [Gracilibacillus halotolerans]